MGYKMEIYVDGGCRGNGQPGSVGAAAAVFKFKWGGTSTWTRALPSYPPPTNQRAEITAIIVALQQALQKYAIGCMTEWVYKWVRNGWINAAGNEVANRDLIEEASDLDDRLKEEGTVTYVWIPRAQNQEADEAFNDCMDDQ